MSVSELIRKLSPEKLVEIRFSYVYFLMYLLIYFFHSEARVYGSEANIAVAVLSENAVATLHATLIWS